MLRLMSPGLQQYWPKGKRVVAITSLAMADSLSSFHRTLSPEISRIATSAGWMNPART